MSIESIDIDKRRTLIQIVTRDFKQSHCLFIERGATLGRHYHEKTDEFFYVIKGQLLCVLDEERISLSEGDTLDIPRNKFHTLQAVTDAQIIVYLSEPFNQEDPDIHGKENSIIYSNTSKE